MVMFVNTDVPISLKSDSSLVLVKSNELNGSQWLDWLDVCLALFGSGCTAGLLWLQATDFS